ncbi:MAG TPA: sulfatase [Acidimicrobiales bacterium]|nr:sulfatase [Acidimicrobiales bacterium]
MRLTGAFRRTSAARPLTGACLALLLLAAGCSSGGSGSSSAPTTEGRSTRPNILFVLTDDLDLREIAEMPFMKAALMDEGVTFSNYFVSVSLCCPSRSTTLRGQYSHNTGVETNGGSNGGFETAHRLGLENSTIATWLHSAGYRTALIGKYLNGYPDTVSRTYVPPGWDEFDSAASGNPYSEYDYTLNENGKLVHYGDAPGDYGTDVYVAKTRSFIERAASAGQPFFAYLAVYAPHQPATPAPQDVGRFAGAKAPRTPAYDAADVAGKPQFIRDLPLMSPKVQHRVDSLYERRIESLQAVDRGIGKLIDTLKLTGQLDHTYIVFASDNGFHLGQFRMPSGKQTAYEFDTHVPLVVRGPGIPPGRTADQLVGNIDLAPTFAAMAGVTPPSFVDGRSFLPLAEDPSTTASWRDAYLIEHWREVDQVDRSGAPLEPGDADQGGTATSVRTSKASLSNIPEYHAVRTTRYLYVEYVTGERELYDLRADPYELHDIVTTASPALVRELAAEVDALRNCKAATCRTAENRSVP